jgi:hypothetical protein
MLAKRATAEPPNVYFGMPDSYLPAVKAQLRKMSARDAPAGTLSQSLTCVAPVPKRPIWMLSWIFDRFHEPNAYRVSSLIGS